MIEVTSSLVRKYCDNYKEAGHRLTKFVSTHSSRNLKISLGASEEIWRKKSCPSCQDLPTIIVGYLVILPYKVLRVPEQLLKTPKLDQWDDIAGSVWATRAWKFQEGFFSNRALIFNGFMSLLC